MGSSHDFYDQILNSAPSQRILLLVLTKLKEEGEIDRVIQECLKALEVYPNDIYIRRLLAESYLETSQVSSAEIELNKTIGFITDLADVYKIQAGIHRKQGRIKEAIAALKIYLSYHPQDEDARRLYDELIFEEEPSASELRSPPEAIATTFEEDSEEKLQEIVTPTLAELYLKQGEPQKAIDTYRTLLEQHPENTHFRERLEALEVIPQEEAQGDQGTQDTHVAGVQKAIAILESWRANIREQVSPN
jgi:tetratricopeptide (TPR) repeat protein